MSDGIGLISKEAVGHHSHGEDAACATGDDNAYKVRVGVMHTRVMVMHTRVTGQDYTRVIGQD